MELWFQKDPGSEFHLKAVINLLVPVVFKSPEPSTTAFKPQPAT